MSEKSLTEIKEEARNAALKSLEKTEPDMTICDRIFCQSFVLGGKKGDFYNKVKELFKEESLKNERTKLIECLHQSTHLLNPCTQIIECLLGFARSGNARCKEFILNLYKKYYKEEYKIFRRSSSFSYKEIRAIFDYPDAETELAIFITLADLFGIKMENKDVLVLLIKKYISKTERIVWDTYLSDEEEEQLDWLRDDFINHYDEALKESKKVEKAVREAFPSLDYLYECGLNEVDSYRSALWFLKKMYPDSVYFEEETIVNVGILFQAFSSILVDEHERAEVAFSLLNNIVFSDDSAGNEINNTTKEPTTDAYSSNENAEYIQIKQKCNLLSEENKMLKNENRYFREQIKNQETQKVASEDRRIRELEKEVNELKHAMILQAEEDLPPVGEDIEQIKRILSEKNIIIVGGHQNWSNQLKKLFPKWTFVNPGSSNSVNLGILCKADFVFFNSKVLEHRDYYRIKKQIPKDNFGYLSKTNLNLTISEIYMELLNKGIVENISVDYDLE